MNASDQDFQVPDQERNGSGPNSQLDLYAQIVAPTSDEDFLERNNLGLGNYGDDEYWQQMDSFKQGMYGDAAFARDLVGRSIDHAKRQIARHYWDLLPPEKQEVLDPGRYARQVGDAIWAALPTSVATDDPDEYQALRRKTLERIANLPELQHNRAHADAEDDLPEDVAEIKRQVDDLVGDGGEAVDVDERLLPVTSRLEALDRYADTDQNWTPPQWRMLQARHEGSRSRDARLMDNVFGRIKKLISNDSQQIRQQKRKLFGGDNR